MAEVTRLVCDKCGTEERVGKYRVSTPFIPGGRMQELDLCEPHAAPLLSFEGLGKMVEPVAMAPAKTRVRKAPPPKGIFTQAELDALEASNA